MDGLSTWEEGSNCGGWGLEHSDEGCKGIER